MKIHHELLRILIAEEIDEAVARAARGSGFLRAGECAYRIAKSYPNCGMTGTELVNEISAAAARAGVAVEIYPPASIAA